VGARNGERHCGRNRAAARSGATEFARKRVRAARRAPREPWRTL